ncbi:LIP-domain-containing protein [Myriangium duriaei CBS 260.36]|uniref:LIP-domain-containing protein n=1 Tax=Myriangium duriaei CBS 260.36 TaxID=1168546 RepID=A0A9P4J090_9PEZI|nr:LIP-domain-containing protein [Myriangium duriaei CBS 260.36]
MLKFVITIVALLITASFTAAAPASSAALGSRQADLAPPTEDPFYKPPRGFKDTAPGTVLRSRSIESPLSSSLAFPVQAWQLLYRTTAVDGCPVAGVTTIFKPIQAKLKLDCFVSYATAYDSSASKCDPSYAYRQPSNLSSSDTGDTDEEFFIIEGYLNQGYIVASPDYEDVRAAFGPGHLAGMSVLDNMRAVTNFGKTIGFGTKTPAIVGQGYSGGAIATGWAASLQPDYAPELPIKGWAHGGTPANLTGVTVYIDGTSNSGYLPAVVAGLAKEIAYGAELQPVLSRILTAKGRQAIQYADTHCSGDDLNEYHNISLLSYDFQTLGPHIFQQPTIKRILQDNLMGAKECETPTAPVLVYHSMEDEIIPYANASALVDRWCARGASVTFSTYPTGSHAGTAAAALPEVYAFVNNAFAENVIPKGCVRNTQ